MLPPRRSHATPVSRRKQWQPARFVYHCTQSLDCEADDVRRGGLLPLTRKLVGRRIADAAAQGALAPDDVERLLSSDVLTLRHQAGHEGQVCFMLGGEGRPIGLRP